MKTFAWQVKNGKSTGPIKMASLSKDAQTKAVRSEDMAGNSSEAGPSTARNSTNDNVSQNRKRKVFESLKVIGIVLILLVLLTGPFVVLNFMTIFNFEPHYSSLSVLIGLSFLNSAINPFVYGWKVDPLKEEIRSLFRMRRQD
jgi:hypothetical protein